MNLLSKFIDIVYPPRCPICREFLNNEDLEREGLRLSFCPACFVDFRRIYPPFCTICGTPFVSGTEEDHLCEDCLRKRPCYLMARSPYLYKGLLMTAIHYFKYGAKPFLGDLLGPILAQSADNQLKEIKDLVVMPVPLHPKRLRERGFNQSSLLAGHVAHSFHADLDFLSLRRTRYTSPQTRLGKKERRKNVKGAFNMTNPDVVKGKTILLVDDVATTGSTLNECSKVIKEAGCDEVLCLVLARTVSV